MPDYFRADQLAAKLKLTLDELKQYEELGLIHGVKKGSYVFYTSNDLYKLRGLLHFMRDEGMSLKAARARLSKAGVLVSASVR
jgi:DNA-binding transcriptional MerR regulator